MSGNSNLSGIAVPLAGDPPVGWLAQLDAMSGDRIFWGALCITTLIKLILIGVIPLTGDEAYFVLWGENLDYGYYDHGAMTGWWLAAVLWIGKNAWLVRLPAILASAGVGWMLWKTLRPMDREKAGWVAAVYLWSPHSMINVFMTTDTALLFFSAAAGMFAFRACRNNRLTDFLLAGFLLGLAFLSKYFAVLLGLSFGVAFLFFVGRPRVLGLLLTFLAVLPSAAVNVAWNYRNGWTNIVFNMYTRQNDSGFSLLGVALFIGITLLLLGPLAWYLLRPGFSERYPIRQAWGNWRESGLIVFVVVFVFPQLVLLWVSFTNTVGVHWPMSFYPFIFAALPGLFTLVAIKQMARVMAVLSASVAVAMMIIVSLPVEVARKHPSYASIVMGIHPHEVLSKLKELGPQSLIATPSYSKSSILSFYNDTYVPVIGPSAYHGRQDDLMTDLRDFEPRDMLIITHKLEQAQESLPWFRAATIREFELRGAKFLVVDGKGFRYPIYHRQVLRQVAREYYQVPPWLADWSPISPFLLRYDLLPKKAEASTSNRAD